MNKVIKNDAANQLTKKLRLGFASSPKTLINNAIDSSMHECMLSHFSRIGLCDPVDCSPPASTVRGILQARILEWVAMPSSRGSSWPRDGTHGSYVSCICRQVYYTISTTWEAPEELLKVKVKLLSHVRLFATLWTVAYQAPPSMGFSKQEYWNGLPCPPPVDLPNTKMEPASLMSPALTSRRQGS